VSSAKLITYLLLSTDVTSYGNQLTLASVVFKTVSLIMQCHSLPECRDSAVAEKECWGV